MRKPIQLPKNKKILKTLMQDAMKVAFDIRVDELDCSKSLARQPSKMLPNDALELLLKGKTHWVFIERTNMADYGEKDYFDIGGASLLLRPDYFLWINVTIEEGVKLIEKYKLNEK